MCFEDGTGNKNKYYNSVAKKKEKHMNFTANLWKIYEK